MQMKMVQVVINIPQIAYDAIYACKDIEKDNVDIGELGNILLSAVEKGIVLPEHHGRLIDVNSIGLTDFEIVMCDGDYKQGLKMLCEKIDSAPTILEGEK